jgi:hypothetical protein
MKNMLKYSAIALVAMVGCGTQVVDFPEEGGAGGTGGVGGSDPCAGVECAHDAVCVKGQCILPDPCLTGACDPCAQVECPEGQQCVDGQCVPKDPCEDVCCPEGQECVEGECVTPDPCADVECCDGEECVDGECVPQDPCGGECSEGEECQNGQCVCNGDDEPNNGCGSNKTLLCHHAAWHKHNICVGNPAVSAHLAHGDTLGSCSLCF